MNQKHRQQEVWRNMTTEEINHYWNFTKSDRRRKWFVELLKGFDFNSIFEVGVNCGRNIYFINQEMPKKKIGGLDVNSKAIEIAKKNIPQANLYNKSAYDMDTKDKYDIVFTSGMLLHVPLDGIKDVMINCVFKSNKYVIHMETHGEYQVINGPKEFNPSKKIKERFRCIHNYIKLYDELGYKAKVIEIPDFGESDAQHMIVVKIQK